MTKEEKEILKYFIVDNILMFIIGLLLGRISCMGGYV
jgi:hypothetical protein